MAHKAHRVYKVLQACLALKGHKAYRGLLVPMERRVR